jgi:hypothetical protein
LDGVDSGWIACTDLGRDFSLITVGSSNSKSKLSASDTINVLSDLRKVQQITVDYKITLAVSEVSSE